MQRQPRRWHDDGDATGEEEVESASLPVTATKAAPTMAPRPQRQPVGSVRNRWQPPNSTRSMPSSQSVQAVLSYRTAPIRTTAAEELEAEEPDGEADDEAQDQEATPSSATPQQQQPSSVRN